MPCSPADAATAAFTTVRVVSMPDLDLLRRLWASSLGTDRADEHYFLAGGTSITAAVLIARVNREFGASVRLGDFLRAPSLANLYELASSGSVAATASPVASAGRPSQNQLFRLDAMYRDEELARARGISPVQGLVTMWLEHDGPVDRLRLRSALRTVAARHTVLRSQFTLANGEWQVTVAPDADPELVEGVTEDWLQTLFPLDGGCWLRAAVLDGGSESTRIAVITDHLVWDGFSAAVVRDELWSAYVGITLAPVPDYYTWVAEVDATWNGPRGAELAAGWRAALASTTLFPPFPFEAAAPDGADRHARVDLGDVDALTRRAAALGATGAGYVLALWFSALLDVAGQVDGTVVHLPVANRDDRTARSIGWFANVMAVPYTRADHRLTPAERVRAVSARVFFAVVHADLPLHTVVPDLDPLTPTRSPRVFASIDLDAGPPIVGGFRPVEMDPPRTTVGGIHLAVGVRGDRVVADLVADPRHVTRDQLFSVTGRLAELAADENWTGQ
ncbi:condensation domain-containing protein [Micromonospora lupini]|uniref:condensation domain-containing protein n=1 Tax=Micromonospora lupini TaxID=285679 RepID=UPI0033DD3E18